MDRSFPDEITSRYYIREDHGGTQRVFADSKGEREVFQDNGEKLRAKAFDVQGVRLMVETAAHRGWTSIEITGSKEFRRETWLEGQAHGISVKGYQPTEMDWQELARREQTYLRNEIMPMEGRALDAAHRDQEQSSGAVQSGNVDSQSSPNSGMPHSKTADYKEGVRGILVETGEKPYQDNEKMSLRHLSLLKRPMAIARYGVSDYRMRCIVLALKSAMKFICGPLGRNAF